VFVLYPFLKIYLQLALQFAGKKELFSSSFFFEMVGEEFCIAGAPTQILCVDVLFLLAGVGRNGLDPVRNYHFTSLSFKKIFVQKVFSYIK